MSSACAEESNAAMIRNADGLGGVRGNVCHCSRRAAGCQTPKRILVCQALSTWHLRTAAVPLELKHNHAGLLWFPVTSIITTPP